MESREPERLKTPRRSSSTSPPSHLESSPPSLNPLHPVSSAQVRSPSLRLSVSPGPQASKGRKRLISTSRPSRHPAWACSNGRSCRQTLSSRLSAMLRLCGITIPVASASLSGYSSLPLAPSQERTLTGIFWRRAGSRRGRQEKGAFMCSTSCSAEPRRPAWRVS